MCVCGGGVTPAVKTLSVDQQVIVIVLRAGRLLLQCEHYVS